MRMKQLLITLSLFTGTGFTASAQAPGLGWQKALGGTSYEGANGVIQTSDSNYLVFGIAESSNGDVATNHGPYDCWLVKLSQTGTIIWQQSLGGSYTETPYSIQETSDGGFIMAAETKSTDGDITSNHGNSDAWIVKLSPVGSIQWQKSIGGSGFDVPLSVKQTADGGFIVAGWTSSNDGDVSGNKGGEDCWLIKLTPSGVISWQKTFGGTGEDHFTGVAETADGGFICSGIVKSTDGDITNHHGMEDIWIVKVTSTGALSWQKTIGGSGNDYCGEHAYSGGILQTADGGYILAGWSNSSDGDVTANQGHYDAWVVKLTPTGSISWQKSFGGTGDDEANSIQVTADGGYLIGGLTNSTDGDVSHIHGDYDFWVLKLTPSGSLEWERCYGGAGREIAFTTLETFEGDYIVAGYTTMSSGQVTGVHGNNYDMWVAFLASPTGVNGLGSSLNTITMSPNPTSGALLIQGLNQPAVVKVYGANGQLVLEGNNTSSIYLAALQSGVYFVSIADAKGHVLKTEKIIKQ